MRNMRLPAPLPIATGWTPPDVAALTIEGIRAGYESGAFTPSDVCAAVLARISAHEPFLNALVSIDEAMVGVAARSGAELSAGGPRGPLHGIPVVIKANMNEAGIRTTAGYAGFASDDRVVDAAGVAFNGIDLVPSNDATLVARLRQAGAIIVGRSNLPDFGLDGLRADSSHNGDTLNPYGPRFAPGASSTGGAAAVAVGFGTVSVGPPPRSSGS